MIPPIILAGKEILDDSKIKGSIERENGVSKGKNGGNKIEERRFC